MVALRKSFLVIFPLVLVLFPFTSAFADPLRIYHIDVEQGDSTLIVSPSGNTLLIDSGKNGHGSRIKAIMQQAGVNQIDYVVTTHYHEDHYGGIDELVSDNEITVSAAFDRGDKDFLPASKITGTRFQEYENSIGINAVHLMRGETIPLDTALRITCISSGGVVIEEENPVTGIDENDMSISLLIQFGEFRYFIGGDIEEPTEVKIAQRDLVRNVDVYQANHHGSNTSSSTDIMEDLIPRVIIISNGNDGGYQHPRQETLNVYSNLNPSPTVFQTNKYLKGGEGGNVPDEFIADVESSDSDGTILVTVAEDFHNYTVSYRGVSHAFQTKMTTQESPSLVIDRLLPRPHGSDRENEAITLRNDGDSTISMEGWVLQDRGGRIWTLVSLGSITPGQTATIQRNGMPMSLNNNGDEIVLINPGGQEVDRFSYNSSEEGVWLHTNH